MEGDLSIVYTSPPIITQVSDSQFILRIGGLEVGVSKEFLEKLEKEIKLCVPH